MSGYLRPLSLMEGLSLINADTRIVAGATDVIPARTSHLAWGRTDKQNWLDITGLSELKQIQGPHESSTGDWHIGALVTWAELIHTDLPTAFDGIKAAAREVGGVQIQNRATLVGNLCNASPAADGVPPLLCLNASVEIRSTQATRYVPLQHFIQGNRQTALQSNEMVTAICVPPMNPAARGYFQKLGARRYMVISIVMASAVVNVDASGIVEEIYIAIGSCSEVAQRMTELEQALVGRAVTELLSEKIEATYFASLSPIDDVRSNAAYRRCAAAELVDRLLHDVQTSAGKLV